MISMTPSLKSHLLASCLLLLAATPAAAQAPALTAEQQALLKARQEELARQRALVPPVTAGSTPGLVAAVATPPDRMAGAIEATIQNLNENRAVNQGRGNVSMNFNFNFAVPGLDPAAVTVRRVQINRAIDNLDRPVGTVAGRGNSPITMLLSPAGRGPAALRGNAPLMGPSRDATALKLIEGEVELFVASADNGSQIRIPAFTSNLGKAIDHPALKANGIDVQVVNKEGYAALAMPGIEPNFATSTVLFIRDPGSRFVRYEVQDEAGAPINAPASTRTSGVGMMLELRTPAPLPAGAQLVMYAAVPEAVKIYSFKLENVQLP